MVTSAAKIADITNEPSAGGYLRKGGFVIKYIEKNVNPKKRKTGDCSTRALVGTLGIPYDEALKLQTEVALKTYYKPTIKQDMKLVVNSSWNECVRNLDMSKCRNHERVTAQNTP